MIRKIELIDLEKVSLTASRNVSLKQSKTLMLLIGLNSFFVNIALRFNDINENQGKCFN